MPKSRSEANGLLTTHTSKWVILCHYLPSIKFFLVMSNNHVMMWMNLHAQVYSPVNPISPYIMRVATQGAYLRGLFWRMLGVGVSGRQRFHVYGVKVPTVHKWIYAHPKFHFSRKLLLNSPSIVSNWVRLHGGCLTNRHPCLMLDLPCS